MEGYWAISQNEELSLEIFNSRSNTKVQILALKKKKKKELTGLQKVSPKLKCYMKRPILG